MNQEVAVFQKPRLPFAEVIQERFGDLGVDRTSWKALVEAVFPSAKTVDAVVMALSYCKARKLDPFKRPVHIVPVWDSKSGKMIETVWPGISELRTTAHRTNNYAGCDEVVFGPDVEVTLKGKDGPVVMTFPSWGRMTIYRFSALGVRYPIVGPRVDWLETYATESRNHTAPNSMWRKRPRGQLEKCIEAAALRRAFPEELGNEYAAEEMFGKAIGVDGLPVTETVKAEPEVIHAEFDDPKPPEATATAPAEPVDAQFEDAGGGEPASAEGAPATSAPGVEINEDGEITTVRMSVEEVVRHGISCASQSDWPRVDAMTDEQIATNVASDPDAQFTPDGPSVIGTPQTVIEQMQRGERPAESDVVLDTLDMIAVPDPNFDYVDWALSLMRGMDAMDDPADIKASFKIAQDSGRWHQLKSVNMGVAETVHAGMKARIKMLEGKGGA